MPTDKDQQKESKTNLFLSIIIILILIALVYLIYNQSKILREIAQMSERTSEGIRVVMNSTCKMLQKSA